MALAFVRDKIGVKLQGWKQKLLTFAGREVLIKAVENSIPTYPMTCFLFPKKSCEEIDRLISRFWWGQKEDERVIHWKSWRKLTSSKGEGEMGFRDLLCFNKALLAKSAWRLMQNPRDLWCQVLNGIYFPKGDFMKARKGRKASWGWSSLLEGRDLLLKKTCWKVGDGRRINIWEDKWILGLEEGKLKMGNLTEEEKKMRVVDVIEGGRWNLSRIEHKISLAEREEILKVLVFVNAAADRLIWLESGDGCYPVKSGYKLAKEDEKVEVNKKPSSSYVVPKQLWKCIWRISVPLKVQHFLWRIGAGAVATREALFRRSCANDPLCPICKTEAETTKHLFFFCPWTKSCWLNSDLGLKVSRWEVKRCEDWMCEKFSGQGSCDEYKKSTLAMMLWWIWKKRCGWVFRGELPDAEETVRLVQGQVEEFWKARRSGKNKDGKMYEQPCVRLKRWMKPEVGEIKINVDGSFCVVCRDERGCFVGGRSVEVKAVSAFMTECLAVREVLKLRRDS